MDHLPSYYFQKCVARYRGDCNWRGFSCWDQYLAMAFAQLTYRESLRDIEACLRSMSGKLYHRGFRSRVARSTLAEANESRDGRIYADFAQVLTRCGNEEAVQVSDQQLHASVTYYRPDLQVPLAGGMVLPVSYTHLRAHE